MADIDQHSSTWNAIKEWIKTQREEHNRALRADRQDDDKHRGALDLLDELEALETPAPKLRIAQRAPSPDRA